MSENLVLYEQKESVALLTLNAPQTLNALSRDLIAFLNKTLDKAEADSKIRTLILTGTGKAFAAGAHINEMKDFSAHDAAQEDFIAPWEHILKVTKPIIAAINGFALGGGCELAMMCDIRVASTNAQFGQPEIKLGTLPGAGGTQRLTHIIGQSRAMELCLAGRHLSASEAYQYGLVSTLTEPDDLLPTAFKLAEKIGQFSQPVVKDIKRLIRSVEHQALAEGITEERKTFYKTFDLKDQKEGMNAFLEKRAPQFKDY